VILSWVFSSQILGFYKLLSEIFSLPFVYIDSSALHSSIIQAMASIIAISFSISILAVQHAASNYSPSILEKYKKDKQILFIFSFYSITLIFSTFSLTIGVDTRSPTLYLFVFSLILLLVQFNRTINLMNPKNLVKEIENTALKNISKIPDKIHSEKVADPFMKNIKEKLPNEFFSYKLHSDESLLKETKDEIMRVVYIARKSILIGEKETSFACVNTIHSIVKSYIDIRKEDTTYDDKFIEFVFNQLIFLSDITIESRDEIILQNIIEGLEKIGSSACDIKTLGGMLKSNLSVGLAGRYIGDIGSKAYSKGLSDSTLQSVLSLQSLGIMSINKTKDDSLISEEIIKLANNIGIVQQNEFILRGAIETLVKLTIVSVLNHYQRTEDIMEKMKDLIIRYIRAKFHFMFLLPILNASEISSFSVVRIADASIKILEENFPEIETRGREEWSKRNVSTLIGILKDIGIEAQIARNYAIISYIIEGLKDICLRCSNVKFKTYKDHFSEELLTASNVLNSLFPYREDSSIMPAEISETLTLIAMSCINNGLKKTTVGILNILNNISKKLIQLDNSGSEPLKMVRWITVLGVYAIKKSLQDISVYCAKLMVEFDKEYKEKSPNPKKLEHIERLRKEIKEPSYPAILPDSPLNQIDYNLISDFEKIYEDANKI